FPSLVAVIVTGPPAATPRTSPDPLTLAMPASLLAQVTVLPARTLPAASLGVAASWTVLPVSIVAVSGATLTVATGGGEVTTLAIEVSATRPPVADPITRYRPAAEPAV